MTTCKWFVFFLLFVLIFSNVRTVHAAPENLYARYALLMDATNRRVLFEKNGYEEVPMASTTKIMTLLIALEQGNLDDVVTISKYCETIPRVRLGMKEGEQYRLKDLLYCMMLESYNDAAVAVAEHIGGSVSAFALLMNEKAEDLGAYHTQFVTPNGLDAEGHYTTAYDLALITSYAIDNEMFREIISTSHYSFHEQTKGTLCEVDNKDVFLTMYEGAIGVKTGFTSKAGYCFVGAVEKNEKRLVSVVLASGWPPNKSYKWQDTTKLMDHGINDFTTVKILSKGDTFHTINVENAIQTTKMEPYVDVDESLLLKTEDKVNYDIELPENLNAPVLKGTQVGNVTVTINDEIYKKYPLYADKTYDEITFFYIYKKIVLKYVYLTIDFFASTC